MANPQIEDGYVKIANELFDALIRLKLPDSQHRILLYIIRRTYGFNQKSAEISLSEISKATDILPRHVSRELKILIEKNIISAEKNKGKKSLLCVQKDYSKWADIPEIGYTQNWEYPKQGIPEIGKGTTPEIGNSLYPKLGIDTIKDNYKDNIKDNICDESKKSKKSLPKKKYGEYNNVKLTDGEFEKLKSDYGEKIINEYIRRLDGYIESKGAKYKNHNATIRNWLNNANVKKLSEKPEKIYYYGEDDAL